jgi:hypothetical protein
MHRFADMDRVLMEEVGVSGRQLFASADEILVAAALCM